MDNHANANNIMAELYFLITKFLANGPFKHIGEILIREIEEKKILPPRIDWTGSQHQQSYSELERKYAHVGPNHLLEICTRITELLDKQITPSVAGVVSLLGAGRQSVLRTEQNIAKPKSLIDYCTRIRSMPILDPINRKFPHNIVNVLYGRESSGTITRKLAISNQFYSKKQLLRRTLGHLSAVYCVLFDRTGNYIITGADDLLVKLWSAIDGRLLITFRGASAEITDIAINLENTLLAAGSLDHILRVWDLQTASPIAVLCSHTGMITSVNFCPSPRDHLKYLVTTSTDGSVAFWQYFTREGKVQFVSKPTQYHEKLRPGQAQMIFASFSPGGLFLAAGSADHHVRVYSMSDEGPKRILETEAHSDTVDSIQWAHNGLRFISGSKDGTAHVWHFESQQWKSLRLHMSERLPTCPPPTEENKKLKVTMVGWDLTDKLVVTAVNDYTIKVWNADTGKLHRVMRGHTDELYVLESHPKDPHILISAGHDGKLFIWDIMEGISLANFTNQIDGQGHGGVFDAKWSPDGTMIAATDSHGHILMYGFGSGHKRLKELPTELFFHTDYRPLIRDSNHYVMDEQTQTVPHLMPPPFLVDVDGNPYPPTLQRLVPGRESCTADQLVPNISVGPEGVEVVEGPNAVSNIDRLIAALANRQGPGGVVDAGNERNGVVAEPGIINGGNVGGAYQVGLSPAAAAAAAANNRLNNMNNNSNNSNSPRSNIVRVGLRRTGDVEGVRQSVGNWQRGIHQFKWIRRTYVRPMQHSRLLALRQAVYGAGQLEMEHYRREMRRRPIMISTSNPSSSTITRAPTHLRGRRIGRTRSANILRPVGLNSSASSSQPIPTYRTRAVRDRERFQNENDDDDDHSVTSASSDSSDGTVAEDQISSGSSSSDSQSSDYSDWVGAAEQSTTLEPPKRSKRKRVKPRSYSPSDSQNNYNSIRSIQLLRKKLPIGENGEIPEAYRPPEWLSEVIPRKAPYYPQMGDEVVYFRQGHQRYLEAVRQKNVYKLNANCEPWNNLDLRDHEVVKVIGIKYEIRPPRLCCLKLALMNNDGTLTNQAFTVKYHDMADVIDFIVLKQTFDTAVRRLWTPGDRFRCMIEDGWWTGQITERVALSPEFPDSLFMCFNVRWDNGEVEFMSPWDMEPIDASRLPNEVGGVVFVQPEELRATLYQPTNEEWPRGDRDASCRRIIAGLEEVMGLAIADPFLAPVDLNIYPAYAFVVEYPIDLATIKARFENHFYRRITSAQFDIRYLATNAEKFNQSDSHIVKHARIITDLCLRIVKDHNEVDVRAVYHQLVDTYVTSDSDDDQRAGTSTGGITRAGRRRSVRNGVDSGGDWRSKCRQVLEIIWNCDDSRPFREPVDTIEHPDYLQIIDTPMDLRTIKEDLIGGNYETQTEFFKDMRMIFANSRNYNTNKRSKIYAMTLRLSQLFEEQIKEMFKRQGTSKVKRTIRMCGKTKRRNDRAIGASGNSGTNALTNPGPSTSRQYNRVQRHISDDDDNDEDVDVINCEAPSTSTSRKRIVRPPKRNQSNGVSSSFSTEATPESSGRVIKRKRNPDNNDYDEEEDEESESISSASSSEEVMDDSDESNLRISQMGSRSTTQRKRNECSSDSEESYRPIQTKRKSVRKKNGKRAGRKMKRSNRFVAEDDVDDYDELDVNGADQTQRNGHQRQNGSASKRGRPKKIAQLQTDDEEEIDNDQESDNEQHYVSNCENSSENEINYRTQRKGRGARKYDSDQSYRQSPVHNRSLRNRQPHSDESDTAQARPTRSTTKREKLRWGQEEDSLEETHDDEVTVPKPSSSHSVTTSTRRNPSNSQEQKTRGRRKILQDTDEHSTEETTMSKAEQSSGSNPSRNSRSTRSANNVNRNMESSNGIEDDDDSDDDQVLSQLARPQRNFQKATTTTTVTSASASAVVDTSSSVQNGSLPRTRELIRRKQSGISTNISAAAVASTSISNHQNATRSSLVAASTSSTLPVISETTRINRSQVQEDHNYGEPGPSTLRHSRRITTLSRHQRDPDELDKPLANSEVTVGDVVDPLRLPEHISSRLRNRHPTTSVSNRNNLTDQEPDDEDDDEDNTDPEDNKPLHLMVSGLPLRTLSNAKVKVRSRQSNYSDDDVSASLPGPSSAISSRSFRSQKRPYYNEDSDESVSTNNHRPKNYHISRSIGANPPKRRHLTQSNETLDEEDEEDDDDNDQSYTPNRRIAAISLASSNSGRGHVTRSQYVDDNSKSEVDENDDNTDNEQQQHQISVSSRGRVRKISSKIGNYR